MPSAKNIIIALDFNNAAEALDMAARLAPFGVRFKIGMELFYAEGSTLVSKIQKHGDVFLDLKLHDIPETMAKSACVIAELGVWMFNVHASAGEVALKLVSDRIKNLCAQKNLTSPLLIAVTVLTSLKDLNHLGSGWSAESAAVHLSKLTSMCGFDGVVCSPREVPAIKKSNPQILTVTPGIRGPQDNTQDQIRTASLPEAFALGSDYLVIGRPVTKSDTPEKSLENLLAQI